MHKCRSQSQTMDGSCHFYCSGCRYHPPVSPRYANCSPFIGLATVFRHHREFVCVCGGGGGGEGERKKGLGGVGGRAISTERC